MVLKRPLHCPTKVMESEAFETTVGEIVDGRRWALVTSAFWNTSDKVARLIEAAGPPAVAVTDVKPNPVLSDVIVLADWLGDAELIVALGGGSVMDIAKAIAALNGMVDGEAILVAHLTEGAQLPDAMTPKPIVAVPTTSGTGSEVTPWGTIWGDDGIKFSVNDTKLYPSHAILDAHLCLTMPRDITLATGLDALSHAMESIWNQRHMALTDALATEAITIIRASLEKAITHPGELQTRASMQTAAIPSGLAMGTTQTALAHSISYPFTSRYGLPHGLACAFTLPEIARFNGETEPDRLAPIAAALGCPIGAIPAELETWFDALGVGELLTRFVSPAVADELGDNLITRARAANNIRDVDGAMARRIARAALERFCAKTAPE